MLKKTVKQIYFSLGLIFLILALVGMILPLLPTTPFALVAIYFFDRSSKKFHGWCMKLPGVGGGIEDWKKHRMIRKKAKVQAIILIFISGVIIFLKQGIDLYLKLGVLSILVIICLFLLTRSSLPKQ